MGKIVYLRAKESKTKASSCEIYVGLETWLASKPANTRAQYLRLANEWTRFLGYEPTERSAKRGWQTAKYIDAQRWVNEIKKRPAQPGRSTEASANGCVSMATVKHKVSVLSSLYDQLLAQGLVEANPFKRLVIELKKHASGARRPHVRIPKESVEKLIKFKPKDREQLRDLAIFNLFFGAALRRCEVVALRLTDVKRSDKGTTYLRLVVTKSQKVQEVALPNWVASVVNRYVDQRMNEEASPTDPLFIVYRVNGRVTALSSSTVYRIFKAYCRMFGLPDNFTPHCARVTAITQMLDQNFSHRDVQELSRHSSVTMVEKYDRRRHDVDQSASKKLEY